MRQPFKGVGVFLFLQPLSFGTIMERFFIINQDASIVISSPTIRKPIITIKHRKLFYARKKLLYEKNLTFVSSL